MYSYVSSHLLDPALTGTSEYLRDFLHVVQNCAARIVTQAGWDTPVRIHLAHCNWLSIRQLVVFHRLLLVFKIRSDGKPVYFVEKFNSLFSYRTRLASSGGLQEQKVLNHLETKKSFVHDSKRLWNNLPPRIRQAESLPSFKSNLRSWVLQNIPARRN